MLISRTYDYALVKRILTEPKVWAALGDEAKPARADFAPTESEKFIYLVAWEGTEPLGMFLLIPRNSVHAETHFAMLPSVWGRSTDIGKAFLEWIWRNTSFERLTGNILERNRLAIAYAKGIGCQPFAVNPNSVRRGGKLLNEVLVGISRPAEIPTQ
jgi:RimJ/RimL family protein N-acetyltransferase